jgi:uncharacterized protein DUF6438
MLHPRGVATASLVLLPLLAYAEQPMAGSPHAAIVFHHYQDDKLSSEYRVEVMEDGRVIFTGMKNVREPGAHEFRVASETVREAVKRLNELRTQGKLEPVQGRALHSHSHMKVSSLTVRSRLAAWTVAFEVGTLPDRYAEIEYELESTFPTYTYRCPYYLGSEDPKRPSPISGQSYDVCTATDSGINQVREERSKKR